MELSTIEVNGVSLALRSWGHSTDRPTMLLLHAAGENSLSWKSQAKTWAQTGQVYALDFRGHGESERTDHFARCSHGRRAGPPEDIGGPWGYQELVAAMKTVVEPLTTVGAKSTVAASTRQRLT